MPLFSIITPNYNAAPFVEETIRSIANQTCTDFELIVVDGESTDGSIEILHSLKSHISELIVEKDSGQTNAINKGIKRASGEWIAYLNSDDIYYPDTLKAIKKTISEQQDSKWIIGKSKKFGNEGQFYEYGLLKLPQEEKAIDWVTYQAYSPQEASFIHRSVFDAIGSFDEDFHFAFDCEYWLRMYLAGYRPVEIDSLVAGFRIHEKSKTGTSWLPFLDEHDKMLRKHATEFTIMEIEFASKVLKQKRAITKTYEIDKFANEKPLSVLMNNAKAYPQLLTERFFWGAVKKVIQS